MKRLRGSGVTCAAVWTHTQVVHVFNAGSGCGVRCAWRQRWDEVGHQHLVEVSQWAAGGATVAMEKQYPHVVCGGSSTRWLWTDMSESNRCLDASMINAFTFPTGIPYLSDAVRCSKRVTWYPLSQTHTYICPHTQSFHHTLHLTSPSSHTPTHFYSPCYVIVHSCIPL